MSSVNLVILLGRCGKDAELTYTPTGTAVTKLSLATGESFKDKEGKSIDKTEWHSLIAFGKTGEGVSKYLKKGSQVHVEGKIQTRQWKDKNEVVRYTTEIIVNRFTLLDKKTSQPENYPEQEKFDGAVSEVKYGSVGVDSSDDIPF